MTTNNSTDDGHRNLVPTVSVGTTSVGTTQHYGVTAGGGAGGAANISTITNASKYTYLTQGSSLINVTAQAATNQYILTGNNSNTQWSSPQISNVVTFHGSNNKEIVRLNKDGSVTWDNGINVDEAAEAFSRSMSLGGELAAGITYGVKQRMRDTVFEEIISIAREKGNISLEDLQYLHQAAKIVDKLKGKE